MDDWEPTTSALLLRSLEMSGSGCSTRKASPHSFRVLQCSKRETPGPGGWSSVACSQVQGRCWRKPKHGRPSLKRRRRRSSARSRIRSSLGLSRPERLRAQSATQDKGQGNPPVEKGAHGHEHRISDQRYYHIIL